MEKIEENNHNCLEQKEQLFCLLWICQPVEIKAFQQDHSLLARAGCFQSSFVQFPAITSPLSVEDPTLLTDLWPGKVIISVKHIFRKTPKSWERLFQRWQRAPLMLPSPIPQTGTEKVGIGLVCCINHCIVSTFIMPKSHLLSEVLIHSGENLKERQARDTAEGLYSLQGLTQSLERKSVLLPHCLCPRAVPAQSSGHS